MKPAHKSTVSLVNLLARRFRRSERGATAVEFALVAPVFFAIIGASMETALVFFAGQALDNSVQETSRLIRTGQAQAMTFTDYKEALCSRLYGMFDCDELRVSVREINTFSAFAASAPIDEATGDWTIQERYETGNSTSIVMVEAYYKWPTIIAIPELMTGVTSDGKRLLGAARVFRNEPF
jgi:Flp pilus assembly protein TadG